MRYFGGTCLTCRTRRLLENIKRWLVDLDSWRCPELLTKTIKQHKKFTAVIHKDANHTRTFHCCHGAVGRDYQRSPSRLEYHVCHLVATSAILSRNSESILRNRHLIGSLVPASGRMKIYQVSEARFGRETSMSWPTYPTD